MVPQLATGDAPDGVPLMPLPARRRTRIAYRPGAAPHPAVTAFTTALHASTATYLTGAQCERDR